MNSKRHPTPEPAGDDAGHDAGASPPVMPGFREIALRRADEQAARMAEDRGRLVRELAEQRRAAGLSQTEIAARMGTSQSAVARLETTRLPRGCARLHAGALRGRGRRTDHLEAQPSGERSQRMTPPRVKNSARQPVMRAHIPGVPPQPEEPGRPFSHPSRVFRLPRARLTGFRLRRRRPRGPVPPARAWLDPHADWKSKLYERLMAKRIVLASGFLDDDAAARLSAQLLTLDAEQKTPIRMELQNLRAELSAVLTVMGILDVLRVPVHACVSGEIAVAPPSACSPPARAGPVIRMPPSCSPSRSCISAAR